MANILIIDNHELFSTGIKSYLLMHYESWNVNCIHSLQDAREQVDGGEQDLVLMNLNFPDAGGEDLMQWMNNIKKRTPVIIISVAVVADRIIRLLHLNIRGYITKGSSSAEFLNAIQTVLAGGLYFDQASLKELVSFLKEKDTLIQELKNQVIQVLSEREKEIFFLMLEQKDIKKIAAELFISPKTVENHRAAVYKKLNINDRLSLHNFGREHKLI